MPPPRDYYDVLGVSKGASADELRKAHRRLVRKHHPDVNKAPDAAAKFAEIQQAYDVLSDPGKRQTYDQFGHAGVSGAAGGGGGATAGGQWNVQVDPDQMQDIFEGIFGGRRGRGASPFNVDFGGDEFASRARKPTAGEDLHYTLNIGFMTAAEGGIEHLRVKNGDESQTIDVRIPKGVNAGAKLRLKGKGHPSPRGGPPGDLILTIDIGAHPYFRREGLDLLIDVPITIAEAALGTSVDVPLLAGSVKLKVPPGTSSGQKLRLKGKGIIDSKGTSGDFYAVIQIVAPQKLDDQSRRTLTELLSLLPNPREVLPWPVMSPTESST
jgi:DnaJ-class molecular chaperone